MPKLPKLPSGLKYYASQLSVAFVAFLAIPFLTRVYSTEVYGQYLLIVSAVTLLLTILNQWLGNSINRFLPGHDSPNHFIGNVNWLTVAAAIAMAIAVMMVVPLIPAIPVNTSVIVLTGFFGVFSSVAGIRGAVLIATRKTTVHVGSLIAQNAFPPIIALLLAWQFQPSLLALLWSQVISQGIGVLVSYLGHKLSVRVPERHWVTKMIGFGAPLVFWSLSAQLLSSLDRFMIGHYIGADAAGIYATNYNIVISLQSSLFAPLLLVTGPIFMRLWNEYDDKYQDVLQQTITLLALLAAASFGIFLACYKSIGGLMMGPDFRPGNPLMPWISAGHIAWGFAIYFNKAFEFRQETWKISLFALCSVGVNGLLNVWLIPLLGMEAAAYTTFVSYLFYTLIVLVLAVQYEPRLLPNKKSLGFLLAIPIIMITVSRSANSLVPRFSIGGLLTALVAGGCTLVYALWFLNRRHLIFPIWQASNTG